MTPELLFVGLFGLFAVLGIRSSWRLWAIFLHDGESRVQLLLLSLAIVSTIITAAALYFGVLGVRRLLGFDAFPWSPIVSTIVASIVLLIPAGLERVVDYIGRRGSDSARKPVDPTG